MENTILLVIALFVALVSIGGAYVYWRSPAGRGVLSFFFVLLASLGIVASVVIVLEPTASGVFILSTILGIMFVMVGITIMSIAPLAAITAVGVGLGLAINLGNYPQIISTSLLIFAVSVLLVIPILLRVITTSGIKFLRHTGSPTVMASFPEINYEDTFRVKIPEGYSPDIQSVGEAFMLSLRPWWFSVPTRKGGSQTKFDPGVDLGGWQVFHTSDSELIIGLDRSYIDLRISLLKNIDNDHISIDATTVARYNNFLGKLYFYPVRYGHQVVLAEAMRRLPLFLESNITG